MTPEVRKTICKHIAQGLPREQAASLAGVSVDSFHSCQARFPEFADDVKRATAKFVRVHVQRIAKASKNANRWPASAWLLERLLPESFGKVDRHVLHTTRRATPLTEEYIEAVNRGLGVRKVLPQD